MRKLIVLAALALVANFSFANRGESNLHLRLKDNSVFVVWVDGTQAGSKYSEASITGLQPGNHYIEMARVNNYRGYESFEQVFSGSVNIPPQSDIYATVFPQHNSINFDNVYALSPRQVKEAKICRYPVRVPRANATAVSCQPVPVCTPQPIAPQDFQQLKNSIRNASFSSSQLAIVRQAVATNYFTSYQVKELMELFSFESSRLEVAKLAYPKVLDQQNYYVVNDAFWFSSSVDDLGGYLAMR